MFREIRNVGAVLSDGSHQGKVYVYRTPDPLDEFLFDERVNKHGKVRVFGTDVSLLFNQQRLMQLDPKTVNDLVANFRKVPDTPKVSDEVLRSTIVSRYVQSNADVYAYTRSVNADLEGYVAKMKDELLKREELLKMQQEQQSSGVSGSDGAASSSN